MTRKIKRKITTPNQDLIIASEMLSLEMIRLIEFVESLDPELNCTQSTLLTSQIVKSMPQVFIQHPDIITQIKQQAQVVKSKIK
ncbi:MAG: hypothetical protein KME23_08040 [Goleter apudmare HA4340-LM2]|jgi:hypothetical protein|nr:hypothetical protein [Goleter apudmare HA4340-LM2]